MTENREQSSQSASTDEKSELKLTIEPLAAPLRAVFENLPYQEFRDKFDAHWKEHADVLTKSLKIKARKGKKGVQAGAQKMAEAQVGLKRLYSTVIVDWAMEKLKERTGQEVLFIDGFDLFDFTSEGNPALVFIFYAVEPLKVKVPEDDSLFKVQKPDFGTADEMWTNYCTHNQQRRAELVDSDSKAILPTDRVLIDVSISEDGESWTPRINNQWVDLGVYPDKRLVEEVLKAEVGSTISFDNVEQEFTYKVKVYAAKHVILPEVDDDFAKELGFDNLDALRKDHDEKFEAQNKKAIEHSLIGGILDNIVLASELPPIPVKWVERQASQLAEARLKSAPRKLKAEEREQMLNHFRQTVYRDHVQKLALRWFNEDSGLKGNPDERAIIEIMKERVVWV